MLVKTEKNKSLKIIFSKNEAIKIFGNNRPNLRDKEIQKIISDLFIKISREISFKTRSPKICVEIIPALYGGFLLNFTISNTKSQTMIEFDDIDSFLQAIKLIKGEKRIYMFENKYRIIFQSEEDGLLHLSEYFSKSFFSQTEIAKTIEYGKIIGC
jgi:hypothetical protein